MTKFNTYAKQAETIAKECTTRYAAAIDQLKKAEAARRANPQRGGIVSADYAAKSARAEADYLEAKEAVRAAKAKMEAGKSELARIKKALAADIENSYAADPAQMDNTTVELLKSGILKASEYERLYNQAAKAGNPTMMRLIGKYANDRATDEQKNLLPVDRSVLLSIAHSSRQVNGAEYLAGFHLIEDVFSRCIDNPAMIGHFDELTQETIANF